MLENDVKRFFGQRLKLLRETAGLTQSQLAERIGVTMQYISMVERGLSSPSFKVIGDLCAALQADPASLFLFTRQEPAREKDARAQAAAPQGQGLELLPYLGDVGIWEMDLLTGQAFWSEAHYAILGYRRNEVSPGVDAFLSRVHPEDRLGVAASIERLVVEAGNVTHAYRVQLPNGDTRHVMGQAHVKSSEDGQPRHIFGSMTDVTDLHRLRGVLARNADALNRAIRLRTKALEDAVAGLEREAKARKASEAEAREARQLLDAYLDNTPLGIIEWDQDVRIRRWSVSAEKLFGWKEKEVLGRHWSEFGLVPEDYHADLRRFSDRFKNGDVPCYVTENPNLTKDGRRLLCRWIGSTLRDGDGAFSSMLTFVEDVTAARQAQEELQAVKGQLRLLLDESPVVSVRCLAQENAHASFVSGNVLRMSGYAPEEFYKDPCLFRSIIHPDDWPQVEEAMAMAAAQGEAEFAARFRRKDGAWRWMREHLRAHAGADGEVRELLAYAYDITNRMEAESGLAAAHAQLAQVLRESPMLCFRLSLPDQGLALTYVSDNVLQIYGYEPQALLGLGWDRWGALVHPEDRERVWGDFARLLTSDGDEFQYRFRHKDGRWITTRKVAKVLRDASGRPAEIIGYCMDVSTRHAAEDMLRASEQKFRLLADFATNCESWIGTDGAYVYLSPACKDITGYAPDELMADPELMRGIVLVQDRPAVQEMMAVAAGGGQASAEFRILRKDGRVAWVSCVARGVFDGLGAYLGIRTSCQDISIRKQAEERRQDLERIIRHDLRSPVLAVLSGARLLHEADLSVEDRRMIANEMGRAARRALDMLDKTRDISRIEEGLYRLHLRPQDIPGLAGAVAQTLRDAAASKAVTIGIRHRPEGDMPRLHGDETLLRMLLENLLRNAVEAAPPGSDVLFEADFGATELVLTIHNQGAVPSAVRERFFEKYATHGKPTGTGLGTYSARLAAEAHGGSVTMTTSEAAGTTVTVRLPMSGNASPAAPERNLP